MSACAPKDSCSAGSASPVFLSRRAWRTPKLVASFEPAARRTRALPGIRRTGWTSGLPPAGRTNACVQRSGAAGLSAMETFRRRAAQCTIRAAATSTSSPPAAPPSRIVRSTWYGEAGSSIHGRVIANAASRLHWVATPVRATCSPICAIPPNVAKALTRGLFAAPAGEVYDAATLATADFLGRPDLSRDVDTRSAPTYPVHAEN